MKQEYDDWLRDGPDFSKDPPDIDSPPGSCDFESKALWENFSVFLPTYPWHKRFWRWTFPLRHPLVTIRARRLQQAISRSMEMEVAVSGGLLPGEAQLLVDSLPWNKRKSWLRILLGSLNRRWW